MKKNRDVQVDQISIAIKRRHEIEFQKKWNNKYLHYSKHKVNLPLFKL